MPIQPKCENCGRLNGYTSDLASGLCNRCILAEKPKKKKKEDDDE